jgi:hypothetical protein
MTALGLLNFLVLQWFGVRLARVYVAVQIDRGIDHVAAVRGGGYSVARRVDLSPDRIPHGWTLQRWVWPLTGWWSPYRWLWRR